MPITIRTLLESDFAACSRINRSLPDWFGIEEGLEEADGFIRTHTGLVAEADDEIVGYLTYEVLFPESAEISWMAVSQSAHRKGVGRALIAALVAALPVTTTMLVVKTLADTHPSPEYASTRAFYVSCGFQPTMVLPDLWDESNPCLVMIKPLHA